MVAAVALAVDGLEFAVPLLVRQEELAARLLPGGFAAFVASSAPSRCLCRVLGTHMSILSLRVPFRPNMEVPLPACQDCLQTCFQTKCKDRRHDE